MTITGIGATGSSAATTGTDANASKADAQQTMRLACGGWGQPVCKPPATCGVRG